jgi:diguanylate cyclase (GGDEF)-like protein/PAS domain S-box-containing protein
MHGFYSLPPMEAKTLADILTPAVVTFPPDASLSVVLEAMERQRISCIVAVDARDRPLGLLTERDVLALYARDVAIPAARLADVMSTPVVGAETAMDYREAYHLMAEHQVRHLVAVDPDGSLAGIVTEADFLFHLGEEYLVEVKTVATAMDRHVICLDETRPLEEALLLMHERRSDYVVVLRGGTHAPVGVLTERDVVRLARSATERSAPLGRLMTPGVHAIPPAAPLQMATARMQQLAVRRLLVTDDRQGVVGVITRHDIVKALQGGYVEYLRETLVRLRRELTQPEQQMIDFHRHLLLGGVFDLIGDGIYMVGQDGQFLDANQRGCEVLGYDHAELRQLKLWEVASDVAGPEQWAAFQQDHPAQGGTRECRHRRKDGSSFPVQVRVYVSAAGGEPVYIGVATDLSEKEALAESIRESERFYRHVIDSTVDGFFPLDQQQRFSEVNDRMCELFGFARAEGQGRTPLDFVSPESRAELLAQIGRIAVTEHRRYQLVGQRKDGSQFPILLNTTTHRNAQGELVGSFGFVTDLTPIVAAQQAVADSERELRAIIDNLQDLYYRTDLEGRVVRLSPSSQQIFGYAPDEYLGRRLADLYVEPGGREVFLKTLQEAGGRVNGYEARMRHRDGHEIWVMTNAQYVRDGAGQVVGVEGTVRDITLRRQSEEQIRLAAKVFENSSEGILVTDAENRIVSVNPAFSLVTGYAADEVIGHRPSMLSSGRHDAEFFETMWAVLLRDGRWNGEIWNRRKSGELYPEWLSIASVRDDQGRLTHHVAVFSDISDRKQAEERIDFLAHHDPLTELPNRLLFKDRFERAMAHGLRADTRTALLIVDLDRFKAVNDSLGHPVGDALLREAAHRLEACVRDTDTVCRQGGDEFLVALTDVRDDEAVARVAEKVLAALSGAFAVEGHEVTISSSIGIALGPNDGKDFETLLRKADIAMYHAKDAGRNTFRFYNERMNIDSHERMDLRQRIHRGLERDEFQLHYQPLVDLASGRIVGAEALLRWLCPERGLIAPAHFIPVAEESGLIVPLGEWVLHEACRELKVWHAGGHHGMTMAVNLSAIQFRRGGLEASLQAALDLTGVPASALELELTESILLHEADQALAVIQRLKGMGVRLAIDDFGTGYSSLAYLKRLAVDKLKIDQSFVRDMAHDPDDAAIVRAVIQMAKSLNLAVLAEGVETALVADRLRLMECDLVQGFHFGHPVTAAEFRCLIEGQRNR